MLKTAVLVIGGPGLVLGAPAYLVARLRFRGKAVRTTGVVEHCEEGSPGEALCELTVRFTTPAGEEHTFTEEHAPCRRAGTEIQVMYDPGNPSKARVHRRTWVDVFTVLVMFAMGLVMSYFLWHEHFRNG